MREELAHIAELGFNTLRLMLRWEDFQPDDARIGTAAMRTLEMTLEAAHTRGLKAVVVLFPVAPAGVLEIPVWTTGLEQPSPEELAKLLTTAAADQGKQPQRIVLRDYFAEKSYRQAPIRDIYRSTRQLAAQRYLIDEVVGYFAAHPALSVWQPGQDLDRMRAADTFQQATDWLARLIERMRKRGAKRIVGLATPRSLVRRDTVRPLSLASLCDEVAVETFPPEPLPVAQPWDASYPVFLHALMVALADRPRAFVGLGLASRSAQPIPSAAGHLADEEQQSVFCAAVLTELYRTNAAGVWWAAYADIPVGLWTAPPFDRAPRMRTLGLVRADGSEKPAAYAFQAFAQRLRANKLAPPTQAPRLDTDPERHWYDPVASVKRLLER